MRGRRIDAALRHVGDDRRDERVAELARDPLGERRRARVVLAERHVRTVLLGAADRDDDGRRAGADARGELRPRELVEPDGRGRLRGRERRADGKERGEARGQPAGR